MKSILLWLYSILAPLPVLAYGANSTDGRGVVSTNGGTLGGGQILTAGARDDFTYYFFNTSAMKNFEYYTPAKWLICILLVVAGGMLILKILGIRSIFKGKAVAYEIEHINSVRSRDAYILQTNKIINSLTKATLSRGIKLSQETRDYWRYNIERANIRVPGGFRYLSPDEFHALTQVAYAAFAVVAVAIFVLMNMFLGALTLVLATLMCNVMPMMIVKSVVRTKDDEIRENFPDLYLMVHYELMSDSGTPLATTFKSYTRVTNSTEMLRFVDACLNMFDTYGEMGATEHISKQYREVPEITRLMRLIKQQNEGADIKPELIGFREQIIKDKKFRMEQRVNKLVAKARMSFNLTTIVLVQAIISAMAIYLPDLGLFNF